MNNLNIDFHNLSFNYIQTDYRYISRYKDGNWDEGILISEENLTIPDSSAALHYGQEAFEGLKAYRTKYGGIQLFRTDENAKRFIWSCRRLAIPEIPIKKFIDAIKLVVKANERFVPPRDSNATLYVRPYIIGVGENIGFKPAKEYIFGIFCTPVGSLYGDILTPVNLIVTYYDRAAPNGTGYVKVGGNYGSSLYPKTLANQQGFVDAIYLDPLTHQKIEETSTANFFGITHDNHFVTPISPSILPGITRLSLLTIARSLNLQVEVRDVYIDELDQFKEAAICGTAAVITPIGGIYYKDKLHVFYSEIHAGPIITNLYNALTQIQFGDIKGPTGWIYDIYN